MSKINDRLEDLAVLQALNEPEEDEPVYFEESRTQYVTSESFWNSEFMGWVYLLVILSVLSKAC